MKRSIAVLALVGALLVSNTKAAADVLTESRPPTPHDPEKLFLAHVPRNSERAGWWKRVSLSEARLDRSTRIVIGNLLSLVKKVKEKSGRAYGDLASETAQELIEELAPSIGGDPIKARLLSDVLVGFPKHYSGKQEVPIVGVALQLFRTRMKHRLSVLAKVKSDLPKQQFAEVIIPLHDLVDAASDWTRPPSAMTFASAKKRSLVALNDKDARVREQLHQIDAAMTLLAPINSFRLIRSNDPAFGTLRDALLVDADRFEEIVAELLKTGR